jgi:pyruvate/2-oxoglutarate dehydrogenase complex dihydrolipoamide dehydrogenase (E3) component
MATRFDAIVIGTGQAGPSLASRLSAAGMSIAVIERKRFGGTCVNTGCIPTKTLVASARAAWVARRAADYGVVIDGAVRVDMGKVKARKDAVAGKSETGIYKMLTGLKNCRVIEAHARFTGPHLVQAGGELLEAPKIFINAGARAAIPEIPGIHDVPYLTNASMVDVDYLPEHLLILGGSYVGLEFAQMYRRFGSNVTVFERAPQLLSREDEDIAKGVREILEAEGIRIVTSASEIVLSREGERIKVRSQAGDATGSHVLIALGRIPNTDDLGLDSAGVATGSRGYIEVDDELRTSVPGVWAMGDCNGKGAFTHTSYNDYEIVAANLLDGGSRRVSDRIAAYNVYVDPPLARVGMSEREVRASGRPALMGIRPMTKVGRANEKGETKGFLKVLVDAENHRILGACLLGVECDEAIHCILDIMYAKAPYETIQHAVHIHPTVSELIPTLLGDLKPL